MFLQLLKNYTAVKNSIKHVNECLFFLHNKEVGSIFFAKIWLGVGLAPREPGFTSQGVQ